MSVSSTISMKENCEELPEHAIYAIFLKLHAKTLLRFRTLSRQWNHIITSRAFAKDHYYTHYSNTAADRLLIHSQFGSFEDIGYTIISTASLNPDDFRLPLHSMISQPADKSSLNKLWEVSSSCHGMLCVYVLDFEPDLITRSRNIVVWNPVTRHIRHVQWPEDDKVFIAYYLYHPCFIGLGYDHAVDDYKIVVNYKQRTYVMALKSDNVWRIVGKSSWGSTVSCFFSKPVTLDGDIYWISRSSTSKEEIEKFSLIKFNVTDEKLTILASLPEQKYECSGWQLGQYKRSLCLFNFTLKSYKMLLPKQHWMHVWTLAEEEAKWKDLMDVPCKPCFNDCLPFYPIGFTGSGDQLIIKNNGYKFMGYLPLEDRYVQLPIKEHRPAPHNVVNFHLLKAESLISPLHQ